jgi:FixJ family two-component response regulator
MDDAGSAQVFILDDSVDLCEAMSQLILLRLNASCLCLHGFADLAARKAEVLATRIAFLDVNLGPSRENGVDVYEWLLRERYAGEIYFFSGHVQHTPILEGVMKRGARVLNKPLPIADLVRIVQSAIVGDVP